MNDQRTTALANALVALLRANTVAVNHGALRMVDDKHREPMRAAETQARKVLHDLGLGHATPPASLESDSSDAKRRDLFAAGAPAVPDWFRKDGLPEPVPTLDAVMRHDPRWNDLRQAERDFLTRWAGAPKVYILQTSSTDGIGELAVQVGRRSEKIHRAKQEDHQHAMHRYQLAKITAWRWTFADAMLADDPKNPGKKPPTARMVRVDNPIIGEVLMGADILAALFGPAAFK